VTIDSTIAPQGQGEPKQMLPLRLKILLWAIAVSIVTLRNTDCAIEPGIDSPFRWALNYLFSFDRKAFDHLIYPVGPLCLLKWPAPIGNHIIISTLFYLTIGALFTYLLTLFYCQHRNTKQLAVPILTCIIFMMVVNLDLLLIGCVLLAVLNYKFLNKKTAITVGIFVTVIALFLKTSLFVSMFLIWVSFSIYLIIAKQYKDLLLILVTTCILTLTTGYFLFDSIGSILSFITNNFLFALKYSDLLSLYPNNNWWALGICLASIAAIIIFFFKQEAGFLINISLLTLFSGWKFSMGREDMSHAMYFDCLLILLMILFLIVQKKNIHVGLLLFIAAICCYNYNLQNLMDYRIDRYGMPALINFDERVLHPQMFKQQILDESKQACASDLLADDWRKIIGQNTVDVFPWDLSIIYINGFSYQPSPGLQSQELSTQADASFFRSASAPRYIIWHATKSDKTNIDGIDDQYLPNTCPATFEAIISNYRLTNMANEQFAVWEKQPGSSTMLKQKINSFTVSWGAWINLPEHDSSNVIKARADYEQTTLYGLRSFFYKGLPVYIEYETDSGKILKYAFSRQCSRDGIFVNPLWKDNQLHFVNIRRIRFLNEDINYYSGQLNVTLESMAVISLRPHGYYNILR